MSLITKYGGFWGFLPMTTGRYFWVAASDNYVVEGETLSASDANDGLSPERALRTFNRAITLATASVGDVIIAMPGAHSVSATIAVSKAGLVITGIPSGRRLGSSKAPAGGKRLRTTITSTETAGIIFTVSAANVEISDLELRPPAAGGRGISVSATGDGLFVHDVALVMQATASVTTYGITFPAGVTADVTADTVIRNCYFLSGAPAVSGANGGAVSVLTTAHGLVIEQSTFELQGTAAWADAILSSNAGTLGLQVRDCDFLTPTKTTTVMTDAIDATGMTVDGATTVYRCYFPEGTDAFEATGTLDIMCAENYLASSTSGLITGSI